jgi:hypothetical protein
MRTHPITLAILALFAASCGYTVGVQPVKVLGEAMRLELKDGDGVSHRSTVRKA